MGKKHVRFDSGSYKYAGLEAKAKIGKQENVDGDAVKVPDVGDTCVLM